jgi:hypothetical protein
MLYTLETKLERKSFEGSAKNLINVLYTREGKRMF